MIFKHLELTVSMTVDCQLQIHEGPWKQEQFAYDNNHTEASVCLLYMVESFSLEGSLAFFHI